MASNRNPCSLTVVTFCKLHNMDISCNVECLDYYIAQHKFFTFLEAQVHVLHLQLNGSECMQGKSLGSVFSYLHHASRKSTSDAEKNPDSTVHENH